MRFRLFLGTNELRNVTLKNVAVLDHPPQQAAYSHSAPVGKPLLKAPPFALTVPTVLRCPMAGVAIRDRSNAAVAKNFVPMLFYNSFVVIRCYADELPTNCRRTEERQSAKERSAVVKRRGCPISFGALSFFCKKLQFYFAMLDIFRIFAFVNQYDNPWQR